MATRTSGCPVCGLVAERVVYDVGSGPECSCDICEWCWGADGQSLRPLASELIPRFICPECRMISYNRVDVKQRYCGSCREFKS